MKYGKIWLKVPLRKVICGLLLTSAAALAGAGLFMEHRGSEIPLDSGSLIRFHVIANSDSYADQALKLKVRDEVVGAMRPSLREAGSIEEARKIVDGHIDFMAATAAGAVRVNGFSYPVRVTHGNYQFPEKTYRIDREGGGQEDITLPAGDYEAVRVVIGEGKGANWWCVLFPPLCFVNPPEEKRGGENSPPGPDGDKPPADAPPAFRYDYIEPGVAAAQPTVEYRFKVVEWYQQLRAVL
jgi:stage II sporulation protein R